MQLKPEQLAGALRRELAAAYLVAGEDPLRVGEAAAAIRAAAAQAGYVERSVHVAERGFDWAAFQAELASPSLFAARRVLELRVDEGRIGAAGDAALRACLAARVPDVLLLVVGGAFERAVRECAWFHAFAQQHICIYIWPLAPAELPGWLAARARSCGLELTGDGAELLAQWVEGNLPAAAQELEKLALLHPPGTRLDAEKVRAVGGDSARYDVQRLADAALDAEPARALRTLKRLREEGVEPPLVLWSLARAARTLAAGGAPPGPRGAQGRAQRAARRAPPGHWRGLLACAARADRMIKGAAPGDPWLALADLVLGLCGPQPGRVRQ